MDPRTDTRKRPPPIQVPPPPRHRQVPGENAFAKAKRDELDRQREGRSTITTPVTSPVDGPHLHSRGEKPRKDASDRGTFMTTMTNIMEKAGSFSPRKSDSASPRKSENHSGRKSDNHSSVSSSTKSRHGSTIRSRHSQRSRYSEEKKSYFEDDSVKSVRGELESQTERKRSYHLEAPQPSAPAKQETHYTSYDLTDQCKEAETPLKSPKKKIFGMNLPAMNISAKSISSFKTSMQPNRPPPAVPHMPIKAAKVLGESPGSKRSGRATVPRSDTSKSLPSKLYYDQHSRSRRGNHNGSPRGQRRNVSGKTSPPRPATSSGPAEEAPTPPQKDTPLENKIERQSDIQIQQVYELEANIVDNQDGGVTLPLPTFLANADAIPTYGGISPTKYRPYGAKEYAALIEGQPIASAHAHVQIESEIVQNGGNMSAPLEGGNRASSVHPEERGRWSEENWNEFSRRASKHESKAVGVIQKLRPAFYSPPTFNPSLWVASGGHPSKNTDKTRFLFAVLPEPNTPPKVNNPDRASIPIRFQGELNDIAPTSPLGAFVHETVKFATSSPQIEMIRTGAMTPVQEDQVADTQQTMRQADVNGKMTGDAPKLQLEQSSSKLTDMLSGVSPYKGDYKHDSYANYPSAVPSPLYGAPGQPTFGPPMGMGGPVGPPQSIPTTFPDGSNILWHFIRVNEHMDVLGQIVYDSVQNFNNDQTKIIMSKQSEQTGKLEERLEALKADVKSIEGRMENAHEQSQTIDSKLDQLFEFIKTDIVQPATAQSLKMVEMGKDIKELQKIVHGLQGGMENRSTNAPTPVHNTHGPAHIPYGGLPNHRSQPSLINPYNPAHDAAHDASRMPPPVHPMQERYRAANNPGQWYRPNFGHHTTTRDDDQASVATNPFVNNATGYGGGYGYGNYQYGNNPSEQPFNYGSGGPK